MLKIGLTGGIGSGKSTVAALFNTLFNIPIIDADIIARDIVEPGQLALKLLTESFGKNILNSDGSLQRKKLREIVYSNDSKKKQLEAILHPLIYQNMQIELDKQTAAYSLVCIPLLIETEMIDFVDRILVIDCPKQIQIERVQQRDSLSISFIEKIIASQVSRELRLSVADDIIDNSDLGLQLEEQVKKLHNCYLLLADS